MKWIKPTDSTPTVDTFVIFCTRYKVHQGRYYVFWADWYSYTDANWFTEDEVKYWMPLPEHPGIEEE